MRRLLPMTQFLLLLFPLLRPNKPDRKDDDAMWPDPLTSVLAVADAAPIPPGRPGTWCGFRVTPHPGAGTDSGFTAALTAQAPCGDPHMCCPFQVSPHEQGITTDGFRDALHAAHMHQRKVSFGAVEANSHSWRVGAANTVRLLKQNQF